MTYMLRRNLYKRFRLCHWCGRPTHLAVRGSGKPLALRATVDHIKCKAEAASHKEYISRKNKVLACYECNNRRDTEFRRANPEATQTWVIPDSK